MQERGHRAYKHVDMDQVERNARALPENVVPPEIIRLLPLDELQDKIQMQKSATPVPIARDMQEVSDHLKVLKPNAVVSEKSTQEEFDVNAQQVETIQNLATRIRMERVEARTGNVMIDQFEPLYFSVALECLTCLLLRSTLGTDAMTQLLVLTLKIGCGSCLVASKRLCLVIGRLDLSHGIICFDLP